MPKQVKARAAQDPQEERTVRKLAGSHHAPADWKVHAKTGAIELGRQDAQRDCRRTGLPSPNGTHPSEAVHTRRGRWAGNAAWVRVQAQVDGTGAQPNSRSGQASAARAPGDASRWDHGGPRRARFSPLDAQCTGSGCQSSRDEGSNAERLRRIYVREGVRWRHTQSWGNSHDEDFVPKGPRSSATTPSRPRARRPSAPTRL